MRHGLRSLYYPPPPAPRIRMCAHIVHGKRRKLSWRKRYTPKYAVRDDDDDDDVISTACTGAGESRATGSVKGACAHEQTPKGTRSNRARSCTTIVLYDFAEKIA